jgi:hypothetical protein
MGLLFDQDEELRKIEAKLKLVPKTFDDIPLPPPSIEAKLEAVKIVTERKFDKLNVALKETESRLDTIEIKTLIPIERGERGRDGKDGRNGKDGLPGRDGVDGVGLPGKDGADGKTGKSGKHGVSVIDAEIAADDHLVLKLSDGEIIDAGELPGVDSSRIQHIISSQLPNNQVYVSATAPSNPSVNDLWYDIS